MASGVKPLKLTGFFLYSPGPRLGLMVGALLVALILQIFAWIFKNYRSSRKGKICNRISWAVLLLLLILEAVMIAEFPHVF